MRTIRGKTLDDGTWVKWDLQLTSNGFGLIQVDDCDADEVPGSALADANLTTTDPLRPKLRHRSRGCASLHRAYATGCAHLLRLRLLARRTQGHTKAEGVAAVRRLAPVAVRRPTIHGVVAPTAATVHADRARCRPCGVGDGTTRVVVIPILTPLPNIAVHVIQPPKHWVASRLQDVLCWQSCHCTKQTPTPPHRLQN
jgi:hypothetical protein